VQALQFLRSGSVPDLLITDYLMPGMNGVTLVEEAQRRSPGLKVMLITGYSMIAEGPGKSIPRLAKPFRHADLAEFVAKILASDKSATVIDFPVERGR
jgi:CheY-like chemotaxis protein